MTKYCLCNTKRIITNYLEMEERATTSMDSHQATENQALLDVKLQLECCYSNTRDERHSSSKPHLFQRTERIYAFPTWLGRCQGLDTHQMGAFYEKKGHSHSS
jgi:hypothetical protein